MRAVSKLLLLSTFCSFPYFTFAQSDEDTTTDNIIVQLPVKKYNPKLILGGQFCGEQSFENAEEEYLNGNLLNKGGKLFLRIYIVKPLALEFSVQGAISSLNAAHTEGYYFIPGTPSSTTTTYLVRTNRAYSYALMPLNIQYHLMTGKKLQPYFGIGGGMIKRTYDVDYSYEDRVKQTSTPYGSGVIVETSGYIQLEQGISFRSAKHWQINESVYYQHEYSGRRNNIGLNLGIGYILRND